MKNDEILNILKEYLDIEDIDLDKIPNIDLYIDQVTTFLEYNLEKYKRDKDQKIITKTMINNYAKDKILLSPVKKKYNKKQLISLILIYHLKSIMSITDIGLILKDSQENIEEIYKQFLIYKEKSNEEFYKNIENFLENMQENKDISIDLIVFLINIINEANQRKYLAEKIIDLYLKK
ncbi:DUF1836 domain-containing protein [[Clostridium] colinum]|uniref:DUF1836 domain-containing protein n=1 Tax=[Clostridium] colinum TaxID=36835 RepID=UPI002025050C|nr:DUF1836 domain-containing protein [[Clostridium] colinum]